MSDAVHSSSYHDLRKNQLDYNKRDTVKKFYSNTVLFEIDPSYSDTGYSDTVLSYADIDPSYSDTDPMSTQKIERATNIFFSKNLYYSKVPTTTHFKLLNKAIEDISSNITKKDFNWITSQYLIVLRLTLKTEGTEIIKNLRCLTDYESEIEKGSTLPQTADPCFLALLLRDFLETSMQLKEIYDLTKNIKFCLRVLSWIKLSTEYLPEQQKQTFNILCEVVNDKLVGMKIGDTKLLPGGWCSLAEPDKPGHFMLYLIKRTDTNTYVKTRINSHFPSDSNKSETIQINHDQLLKQNELSNFVHNLFRLQFMSFFKKEDLHLLGNKEKLNYCEKNYPQLNCEPVFMEGQKHINNCVFMAFNAFYIYISNSSKNDKEFQSAFRKYLNNLIV